MSIEQCGKPSDLGVDCVLDQWSDWSDCTKNCDGGTKQRAREILQYPENGGEVWGKNYTTKTGYFQVL